METKLEVVSEDVETKVEINKGELSEDDSLEQEHDREVEADEKAVEKDMERQEQDFGNANFN